MSIPDPPPFPRKSRVPACIIARAPLAQRAPEAPEVGEVSDDAPRDCVRQFPTLSPDLVELVPFDVRGVPRLRVQLAVTEDLEEWERWLLRWVRRKHGRIGIVR